MLMTILETVVRDNFIRKGYEIVQTAYASKHAIIIFAARENDRILGIGYDLTKYKERNQRNSKMYNNFKILHFDADSETVEDIFAIVKRKLKPKDISAQWFFSPKYNLGGEVVYVANNSNKLSWNSLEDGLVEIKQGEELIQDLLFQITFQSLYLSGKRVDNNNFKLEIQKTAKLLKNYYFPSEGNVVITQKCPELYIEVFREIPLGLDLYIDDSSISISRFPFEENINASVEDFLMMVKANLKKT